MSQDLLKKAEQTPKNQEMYMLIEYQAKSGYNEIQEIKLFEGSSVLWGANSNTPISNCIA